ncbi:MAG TPA: NB-ARC domain-containing protein, partial [Chloroflexota bacterium]|nr:NB-ARC domain-containing protein [Chloroflexota bacterium]
MSETPSNLPFHLTSFVGRQAELAAVSALLGGQRLVTLTGVGGSGKTRLAAQLAADQVGRWPDGVWWVELETIADPTKVAEVVAATVRVLVEPVQGPLRSLTAQLRNRRMLVCLDNCEQVLVGAAQVAEALLRSSAEVTVLTTSREPLGLAGEAVWRVPPLSEDDAFALFLERASLVRPHFTLDASSEAAVRTMCARLDGIPLALELAAAWLRTLTPQQIEAGLDDRFALLVRSPRGAVPRQQTLAASIEWSHALLDESDRIVLRRLAVFAGGFGVEAACAVAAAGAVARDDVIHVLGRLVDKSLVVAEERDGESRYRLLETIRQYAADRLAEAGEVQATRDRHLGHFLALAEAIEPELQRDMDAWRTQLEREHDNLRAALDWGLAAPDPAPGRRLAAKLPWLWHLHRHGHEGIEFLRRAVERAPDDRSTLQARLLTGIALVADTASPLGLEYDAAQRALAIATEQGDEQLRALCLTLSAVGRFYTDFGAAWRLSVDALRAAEVTGDALLTDATRALQGI